jgi:hypothetical protein
MTGLVFCDALNYSIHEMSYIIGEQSPIENITY